MNFSLCLIIIIIIIITSSLLILLLLLLLYYVRLDTGFTILRNVHVLWVRAPLSKKKTIPQASTFLPVPETDISSSILSHGIFRFTSPAPSRRTAITLRFWERFYSPASVFAHGGEDGSYFAGLLGFVHRPANRKNVRSRSVVPGRFLVYVVTCDNEREMFSWTFTAPAAKTGPLYLLYRIPLFIKIPTRDYRESRESRWWKTLRAEKHGQGWWACLIVYV